ncbi:MAG TPA: nuclear transport factor 2 family protein [Solirubrobacteraceae bacterium]|jgi:hypothetical protein|nr:nuclear transport factor 2 family protein [Solirubrobacteraceae bacterium]
MSPSDQESSYWAIERLLATYAERLDDGDFVPVGRLLADATFTGGAGGGGDAIEKMLRDSVIVCDDGTPRTKHITTNLAIEVDKRPAQRCRVRTSPRCRRYPAWLCSRSSAVLTTTVSGGGTTMRTELSERLDPVSS